MKAARGELVSVPREQLDGMLYALARRDRSGCGNDEQLVDLWLALHESPNTRDAYRHDYQRFRRVVSAPLAQVTLLDLMTFAESLKSEAVRTRRRRLSSIKSLLSRGHETGYLLFNVGAAMKAPKLAGQQPHAISREQVTRLILAARPGRNREAIRFLYASAARASEAVALTWADWTDKEAAASVRLVGKGTKARWVLLPPSVANALRTLRHPSGPLLRWNTGRPLHRRDLANIVHAAAVVSGVNADVAERGGVSPHWLRHSHATHALERQAPIALVRDTLGHGNIATTSVYAHSNPTDSSAFYLDLE